MTFRAEELACKPESGIEKDAIYLPPVSVEFEVWAGAATLPYRFMRAAVLAALAFADWSWLSAADAAELGLDDVAPATPSVADALNGLETAACTLLEESEAAGAMLVSVWFMEMS
jgi:hypothetical protein